MIATSARELARIEQPKRSKPQQALLDAIFPDHEASSVADAIAKLTGEKKAVEAKIPTVMVMEDLPKPRDTFVLKRGQYEERPDTSREKSSRASLLACRRCPRACRRTAWLSRIGSCRRVSR